MGLFLSGPWTYFTAAVDSVVVSSEQTDNKPPAQNSHHNTGGRGSVVTASEFKSEDSGFDPLAGPG